MECSMYSYILFCIIKYYCIHYFYVSLRVYFYIIVSSISHNITYLWLRIIKNSSLLILSLLRHYYVINTSLQMENPVIMNPNLPIMQLICFHLFMIITSILLMFTSLLPRRLLLPINTHFSPQKAQTWRWSNADLSVSLNCWKLGDD